MEEVEKAKAVGVFTVEHYRDGKKIGEWEAVDYAPGTEHTTLNINSSGIDLNEKRSTS